MQSNQDHNSLWKKNKRARADRIVAGISSDRLRPKDKPTRLFLDNEYILAGYVEKLPRLCTLVYLGLLVHCNTETQAAFPGIEKLKKHTGERNPNSIATAIQILEHYNIITVLRSVGEGFGRSNIYLFLNVTYWLAVDNNKPRIKIKDWQDARYQNKDTGDINSVGKDDSVDTLTNLNKNYPKQLTNQIRSLADQMRINKKPERLAIPRRSTDNFIQTAYEGIIQDYRLPDNTGKLRESIDINIDTIEPDKNGEKRSGDDINIDTLGEIDRKRAHFDENSIEPPDIRYEDDMSAGTAG